MGNRGTLRLSKGMSLMTLKVFEYCDDHENQIACDKEICLWWWTNNNSSLPPNFDGGRAVSIKFFYSKFRILTKLKKGEVR